LTHIYANAITPRFFATKIFHKCFYTQSHQSWKFQENWTRTFWGNNLFIQPPCWF